MLSALYAIARPSIRLSVRRVDHTKTVEVRIMKFSPYGIIIIIIIERKLKAQINQKSHKCAAMVAPSLYFLRGKFHPEILRGSPSGGIKQGRGG